MYVCLCCGNVEKSIKPLNSLETNQQQQKKSTHQCTHFVQKLLHWTSSNQMNLWLFCVRLWAVCVWAASNKPTNGRAAKHVDYKFIRIFRQFVKISMASINHRCRIVDSDNPIYSIANKCQSIYV